MNIEQFTISEGSQLIAFVFKTIVDPFVGKISIMKVVTGKMESGTEIYS